MIGVGKRRGIDSAVGLSGVRCGRTAQLLWGSQIGGRLRVRLRRGRLPASVGTVSDLGSVPPGHKIQPVSMARPLTSIPIATCTHTHTINLSINEF